VSTDRERGFPKFGGDEGRGLLQYIVMGLHKYFHRGKNSDFATRSVHFCDVGAARHTPFDFIVGMHTYM